MRCKACDDLLNAFEATRKSDTTKEYLDLCNRCLSTIDVEDLSERYDLEGDGEYFRPEPTPESDPDSDGS